MQFDPKIVPPDEGIFAQDDLKLPDDLALMGQQLADDAARLASCYPARQPDHVIAIQETSRPGARLWLSGTVAGSLLAVSLLAISLLAPSFLPLERPGKESPAASPASAPEVAIHPALPPDASREPIPVTPASWLGDTSGPELEALMDLWERDQHEVASLSF